MSATRGGSLWRPPQPIALRLGALQGVALARFKADFQPLDDNGGARTRRSRISATFTRATATEVCVLFPVYITKSPGEARFKATRVPRLYRPLLADSATVHDS